MIYKGQQIQGQVNSYLIESQIGSGNISQVYKCINILNNKSYALKIISKIREGDQQNNEYYESEIQILELLMKPEKQHANIANVIEIIRLGEDHLVILELLENGNLFDFIVSNNSKMDEQTILNIMIQITRGVLHLHQNQIVHRDLKPENIVIVVQDQQIIAKIIDFGVSACKDQKMLTSMVGSISYIAQEVLKDQGQYDERCDVWSIGCIFHEMITGEQLFYGESIGLIYRKIIDFQEYTHQSKWQYIIQQCLQLDYKKRISVQQLLNLLLKEEKEIRPFNYVQSVLEQSVIQTVFNDSAIYKRQNIKIQNKSYLTLVMDPKIDQHCSVDGDNTVSYFQIDNAYQVKEDSLKLNNSSILSTNDVSIPQLSFVCETEQPQAFSANLQEITHTQNKISCAEKLNDSEERKNQDEYYLQKQNEKNKNDFWEFLSSYKHSYLLKTKIENIQLLYYQGHTKFVLKEESTEPLDQKKFHFAYFHLIIVLQFLKMYQERLEYEESRLQNKLKMSTLTSQKSPFFLLQSDIYEKLDFLKMDISKEDLSKFLSGLQEIDFEGTLQKKIQIYYKFLKFRGFKKVVKYMGMYYHLNKLEIRDVFSKRIIENQQRLSISSQIDEVTYFSSSNNKQYYIFLNEKQQQLIQNIQISLGCLTDFTIKGRHQPTNQQEKIKFFPSNL